MKNKILLYLFIFTVLLGLFIYINDKKILDDKNHKIERLEEDLKLKENKQDSLISENTNLQYFSLTSNEEAMSYFDDMGIDGKELAKVLEDEIISRNLPDADNDLVPYEGMEGHMRINKVKILNHKWIIADFTDGTYWGEILLSYDLDKDKNLSLVTEKSFLYPIN